MPPSACSKRPMRCLSAPVNAPLLVAEQFGLEQVLLQRRAVHLDEVAVVAQRVVVRRAGNQLLAGARFAANQHGGVALGHLLDDVQHVLQRRAGPDDLVELVDVVLRAAEVIELVPQALHFQRLLDLDLHLLDLERLLHVVEGAGLHRLDRGVDRAERGHQDHRGGRVHRPRRAQHVHAVAAAHLEVAQHDVEVAVVQTLDRGVAVRRLLDFVPGVGQPADQPAAQRIVIIGNEYAAHRYLLLEPAPDALDTGSVTRNLRTGLAACC